MTAPPFFEIVIGLICRGDHILVSKRVKDAFLGGFWEFPGGKIEPGEKPCSALEREAREELGLAVTVGEKFRTYDYTYPDRRLRFHYFWCEPKGRVEPSAIEVAAFRWVRFSELRTLEFPPANQEILDALSRDQS